MKHMNEPERMLAAFGILLASVALILSLTTEIVARRHLAEYQRQPSPAAARHIGFEQQTLASRWSVPDGHAALGTFGTLFGVLLFAVPRVTARKRITTG